MWELTKTPHTDGLVQLQVVVPAEYVEAVSRAIAEAAEPNVPAEEILADSTPGSCLRGARGLRNMTQARLAAAIGAHPSNISAMERGSRPIGKEMAKRLGKALGFNRKVFL